MWVTKIRNVRNFFFFSVVPLIPVIIVLALDPLNYTKRTDQMSVDLTSCKLRIVDFSCRCWLSNLPFYLSFILPIVLCISINSILFIIVACALLCEKQLRNTQTKESQCLSRFSMALCCFIVLSLAWIFGLYAIGSFRLLFQILFCIFSTLTGFFIFILYILTSKTKRAYWNSKLMYSLRFLFELNFQLYRCFQITWHLINLFSNIIIIVWLSW
jgi:hypothetical protein